MSQLFTIKRLKIINTFIILPYIILLLILKIIFLYEIEWLSMVAPMLVAVQLFFLSSTPQDTKIKVEQVEDPLTYIQFNNDEMKIGDCSIKSFNVHKVAILIDENYGNFSLPYNPSGPGKIHHFVFPATQLGEFKTHLKQGLGDVQFIT